MYQFSGKLKIFAIALIVIGALGIGLSFMNAPSSLQEAKEIIAHQASHNGGHETSHKEVKAETHSNDENKIHADENHAGEVHHEITEETHVKAEVHGENHADAHLEHVYHQLKNKPWSALYVSLFFFLGISLLVLAFYASQRVAQSGWSVVLFRVMEAITANLVPTSIIMLLVILSATVLHINHMFPWMAEGTFDPTSLNYDPVIDAKSWWMNIPGWTIRSIIYLAIWNGYRWFIRRNSIKEDTAKDGGKTYKLNYNVSVGFIFLFMLSESMMSWDWIMGLDPHWFSTLFGWYILSSLLVSALTVIALVTIYLRSKGALPAVNDSHIHDLSKFMFGFSIFWTYLWFAQFMLIWYANIPEETTYFALRFNEYKLPFLSMLVMNFVFPILLLINSDYKSIPWFVIIGGLVILGGHYVDVFIMVMPGTVGSQWSFGIAEFSALLFFLGVFIYTVFSAFAKANPIPKGNPFLKESEHYHYYNIEHRGEGSSDHH